MEITNNVLTLEFINNYLTSIAKNIFGNIVKSASLDIDVDDYDEEELQYYFKLCMEQNDNSSIGSNIETSGCDVIITFNNGKKVRTCGWICLK